MATLAELWDTEKPAAVNPSLKIPDNVQKQRDQESLDILLKEQEKSPNDIDLQNEIANKRKLIGGAKIIAYPKITQQSLKTSETVQNAAPTAPTVGTLADLWEQTPVEEVKEKPVQPAEETGRATVNPMMARQRQTMMQGKKPDEVGPLGATGQVVRSLAQNIFATTAGAFAGVGRGIYHTLTTGEAPTTGNIDEKTRAYVEKELGYTPTDPQAREFLAKVGAIPEKVLGSSMGLPPVTSMTTAAVAPAALAQAGTYAERALAAIGKPVVNAIAKSQEFGAEVKTLREQMQGGLKSKQAVEAGIPETGKVSAGAAATAHDTAVKAALAEASPEIQALYTNINPKDINLSALETHNKFNKFGMTPTEGEALQDSQKLSAEMNERLKDKELHARLEERDPKLIEAFNTLREKVAPDVHETKPTNLANMALEKMKADLNEHELSIRNDYKKANEATGTGESPIDVGQLQQNITDALKKANKTKYLPADLKAELEDALSKGHLTAEEYENFRTDTATIQRTARDPLARQAAGIVRNQLEAVPLKDEFAAYKPLYDKARANVVALKNKLKIPAYSSAAADTRTIDEIQQGILHPAANTFMQKHYGAKTPQVNIERMLDIIGRDSPEHQALNRAKIEEFKQAAGVTNDTGSVRQKSLNNIVHHQHVDNLPIMFGNEVAKDFRDLADVAHLSEHTKGKHAVNVSNTEILREQNAAKEAAKSMLATGAEIKANLAVPFAGTLIRKGLEGRKAKKLAAEEAKAAAELSKRRLGPGAGISLQEISKGK